MTEMDDRPLWIACAVSLACHTLLLGFQWIHLRGHPPLANRRALELVYETHPAEGAFRFLERTVAKLGEQVGSAPTVDAPTPQVRVPDRPLAGIPGGDSEGAGGRGGGLDTLGLSSALPEARGANRAAVVDLTNLVDAAQGNPVLLSYFSTIREQIQQTANRNSWLTGESVEGLVYVSFVLSVSGHVSSVVILPDRSVRSRQLHDIALKIIKAAAPFPPFPPSLASEASKTVVVPLEFLLGS